MRRINCWNLVPLLAAGAVAGSPAVAAPPVTLKAPDPVALDFFGTAVAMSDELLVTGFPMRYPALKGQVLSFALSGLLPTLESQYATDFYGDGLGMALATQGDLVVVGAPLRRSTETSQQLMAGRVHLLTRLEDGSLLELGFAQGTHAVAELGASVGLDSGWIIAGAPGGRPPEAPSAERWGQVFFYTTDGNVLTPAGVIAPTAEPPVRNFGQSVVIDGEWAAASANLFGGELAAAGIVSVMHRDVKNQWSVVDSMISPDAFPGDRFGLALAMSDDTLAVGAPAPGHQGVAGRGALFLYQLIDEVWSLEHVLEAPNEDFCEGFGRSVAVGEDILAVGALATDPEDGDAAAVFLFRRAKSGNGAAWVPAGMHSGLASEDFGASLAIAGGRLAIGVPGAAGGVGPGEGAVLVVGLVAGDVNGDGIVDGADLAIVLGNWGPAEPGSPADLNGDGVVDGADLTIVLGNWS